MAEPVVNLTEEMMLNPPNRAYHDIDWANWRRYRIEYGFECGCPEGVIYLPQEVDPETFEDALNHLISGRAA